MIESEEDQHDRVIPPSAESDDEALREYGRQLAMDSLIRDLGSAGKAVELVGFPPKNWHRRAWISASAASIAAMAGFAVWKFGKGDNSGGDQLAILDSRWILDAAIDAEYRIIGPNHIELLRGELHLISREPAKLLVETPFATALANGTEFLIGHHGRMNPNQKPNTMNMNTMTRLLVLAGTVTLATGNGNETAGVNEAVVAKADVPPEKIVVGANSDFAFRCFEQLAKNDKGGNLFFSPYSISNALLMVAEGARGETALEMGKVLGFPEGLQRTGDDAQDIPWTMSTIRAGQARLHQLIGGGGTKSAEQAELLKREASLEKEIKDLDPKMAEAVKDPSQKEARRLWELRNVMGGQLDELRQKIDTMTLKVANAIWADRTASFEEAWKKKVSEGYGVGSLRQVDFANQHERERSQINAWVEEQTENRIKDLFPEGTITRSTRMVLANAIYFKGDWVEPFPESRTAESPFVLSSGEKIQVPLMSKRGDQYSRYAAFNGDGSFFETPSMVPVDGVKPPTYPGSDGFSVAELSYRGGQISMVVIAPNDPGGLLEIEEAFNAANVAKWISSLKARKTNVFLPKFKMEIACSLNDTLAAMGMPTAFNSKEANFSGMSDSEEFFVGAVMHKAFIEVNEKGTEAAAATGLTVETSAARKMVPFVPTFKADRPFLYLIRDQKTGAILFVGRMLNPAI